MKGAVFGPKKEGRFQISVLTLGTLYEAILSFSSQDRFDSFWPSVCRNARWFVPLRRMCILLRNGGATFEILGQFEKGRFEKTMDSKHTAGKDNLGRALMHRDAQWFTKPWDGFEEERDKLTLWLFEDQPDTLLVLPISVKGKNIGAILFVMGPVEEEDRTMLTALGTVYALHVGMAYMLIRTTEALNNKNEALGKTLEQLKEMQHQLIMQEKMASLGNLVAGVAHEFNTPVGAMNSMHDTMTRAVDKLKETLETTISRDYGDDRAVQSALKIISDANQVIATGTQRVTGIVRSLKSFARLDEAELKRADIHEGLEDTLTFIQHDFKDRIRVIKNFGSIPRILCYPSRLNQVFLNILINSKKAIKENGEITITTFQKDNKVYVAIKDTGAGIPEDHLEKMFEPGFTVKGARVGTRLGLATCYQIVQDHRGEIKVESRVGEGSTFTVILPMNLEERIRDK